MDWTVAERRHDESTVEGRMFAYLARLARARQTTPGLRSDAATRPLVLEDPHVFAYVRSHARTPPVLGLACFSDLGRTVHPSVLVRAGIRDPVHVHSTVGALEWSSGRLALPPWGFLWVTDTH